MTTLFYSRVTNQTDWLSFALIDRLGTPNWGMTVHVDAGSTGTAEVLIQATNSDGSIRTAAPGSGGDALTNETGPYSVGETRVEPGHSFWWHTADPTTYPKLGLSIRAYFGSGSWSGFIEVDDGTFGPVNYCPYGTRLKEGLPPLVALTPTVILTIIGKFASSWKGVIASFFAGRLLDTGDLCSTVPPPMPEITFLDILALTTYVAFGAHQEVVDKVWTWLQAASWPFFCECVPGTPDPPPPPDPKPPVAGDPPVYGPFPCDQSDQCVMLTQLLEQQDMMFGYFSMIRSEIQALQSQTAPWGYVLGTLHSGLSGQGEFAVSGILGLSVEYTTLPSYIGQKSDDPTTYYSLGEIGLGSADGWKSSVKTSHNPHLIMPIGPEITRVSYSLASGAIANIQELVRHA